MVNEILSQSVPRSFDARVHLASPRRALITSILGVVLIGGCAGGLLTLTGVLTRELFGSHFPIFIFFGVLLAIMPAWQFWNYRRAHRLLTYGTVVPATLALGTPTRGHPWPPIRATFALNGTQRSCEFAAEPGFSVADGIALVFEADAALYLPGRGVVSARVR